MRYAQLAKIHVVLRRRARLRQADVAAIAGIARTTVAELERARIGQLRVRHAQDSFAALGATLVLTATYDGAELDRLLDEVHALVVGEVVRVLTELGWVVMVEATFAVGGERGSIDVLAWHPEESALLVVEVKSELPGVDPLLRPLDIKVRLAPGIARDRFGWNAATVSRVVVLPEDRTARRQVERHRTVLRAALPASSREVRTWLRQPKAVLAGLWFLTLARPADTMRNPSAVKRVQRPRNVVGRAQGSPSGRVPRSLDDARRLIDPHNVGGDDN